MFPQGQPLEKLPEDFDIATKICILDRVTSAAALQMRPYIADTMVYPLYLLMQATSIAAGIPETFFIDVFHTLVHSVLNKHVYVQMGRWKSWHVLNAFYNRAGCRVIPGQTYRASS